jgi:hypothetical protein
MTRDDIKVGQKWRYKIDGDVLTIKEVDSDVDQVSGRWRDDDRHESYMSNNIEIRFLVSDCKLIKDVEDLVWTRKSDGYVPEIKYESEEAIVYVYFGGSENGCSMEFFEGYYEKRPRKTPESIEKMKSNAMFK